jgi:hypothetical protein
MPCCAFAAFIVGQILLGLNAVKRFVFGNSFDAEVSDNPATEWRLVGAEQFSATPAKAPRRVIGARWFAAAAVIEMVLLLGGAYGLHVHFQHHVQHHAASHKVASLTKGR